MAKSKISDVKVLGMRYPLSKAELDEKLSQENP